MATASFSGLGDDVTFVSGDLESLMRGSKIIFSTCAAVTKWKFALLAARSI